jgi:hypothetical protein
MRLEKNAMTTGGILVMHVLAVSSRQGTTAPIIIMVVGMLATAGPAVVILIMMMEKSVISGLAIIITEAMDVQAPVP